MTYFILINNQQQGPFTIDELRQRAITSDTLVWAEGMPQWTPAWQVEELKPLFFGSQSSAGGSATPPPPPPPTDFGNQQSRQYQGQSRQYQGQSQGNPGFGSQPLAAEPKKKKSHHGLYISLAVIVIALFIAALTNPGKAEHRLAILKKVDTATEQIDNIKDPMARAIVNSILGARQGMMTEVVRQLIDNNLEYHNYIIFSTTTLHSDLLQKGIRTSVGFLGNVHAVSLDNIIPDIITRQIGGSGGNQENNQEEETTTQTTQDENGSETTTTTKTVRENGVTIDSLTKSVTNRIAEDVAKEVKKQVRQETDSTTASGIEGIVNSVLEFIKNL